MTDILANITFTKQINEILHLPSPLQKLEDDLFLDKNLQVFIKRDDLIHQQISGNKWRKLKYNLFDAQKHGIQQIITFGGAFSNHIYATAAAGKYFGFETVGIIRGDELNEYSSETLKIASEFGMKLFFVSRNEYREMREIKERHSFFNSFRDFKLIPEGGTTPLAIAGVGEMLEEITDQLRQAPDYIFCPVGTAGTISGIIANADEKTKVVGVCVLKNGQYLLNEITNLTQNYENKINHNFKILWNEHHGGYAKKTPELVDFVSKFNLEHDFKIEPIYSGKMFFAFYNNFLSFIEPNSKIVLIHTGGMR